jgi:3-deoxy-7-phosphoheptulonate synthase
MRETNDLHVVDTQRLITPDALKAELPITAQISESVFQARQEVRRLLRDEDPRLLVIVGPCSIHDPRAALDYAERLTRLREKHARELLICMRVYFEKPRTTVGWKGLINDPRCDGSCDVPLGLRLARRLLLDIAALGLPAATELLDPIIPQYIADLITWTAIGARTTESQTHREMASGLSMPVGFKNGTDGGLEAAVNAIIASAGPHHFLGIDGQGRVSVVQTSGNPDGHLVLRGGHKGPNYAAEPVERAAQALRKAKISPRMLIDCSHDNSGKNHEKQPEVLAEVGRQVAQGSSHILGAMIESNLVAGKQALGGPLVYGQSITDACVDFAMTERMLGELANAVAGRVRLSA